MTSVNLAIKQIHHTEEDTVDQEYTTNPGTTTKEGVHGQIPTIPGVEVVADSQEETLGEGEEMDDLGTGVLMMDSTIVTQRAIIDSMIVSMMI